MAEPRVRVVEPSAMTLLPPSPGLCQTCAVDHDPTQPHNPDSFYWRTARHMAGEEPPTWDDALAHVSDEVHDWWAEQLAPHGVHVSRRIPNTEA